MPVIGRLGNPACLELDDSWLYRFVNGLCFTSPRGGEVGCESSRVRGALLFT
jgi:hypothetical protein